MVYEIYSLGDANYLAAIMNAIAALGGNGTYSSLMSLSVLMGVLIIAFQAVNNGGGRFDIQVFVLSIVLYQVIFLPKASVMIYDTYTGSARQVDNVPFGLAWIGSTLNTVSYGITRRMELAFSTPQMTTNGFAGALSTMLNAQRIDGLGIADYGCTASPAPTTNYVALNQQDRSCSISQSVSNYIGDCVVRAIGRGDRTAADIYRAERVIDALRTDYTERKTTLRIGGAQPMPPSGWEYTCKDAYDILKGRLETSQFNNSFNEFLKGRFGEQDPTAALGQAMTALSNAAYNAQDFALNMALRDAVANGMTVYANQNDAMMAAAMIGPGAAQRNVQWSAEATLFSKLIRPLITFFEGMMYATAPFVAFLLGLGTFGLKVALKYLYLPIWVSLWMPVMAICNLYVNMIAQGRMAAFEVGAAGSYTSMAGSVVMFSSLTDWLGTASMLASSVPALTMSLLFGGAVAMSSLAGRLQSGDYTNEKLAAPDVASPSAALSIASTAQTDRIAGPRAFGADGVLPSFSAASEFSASTESARQGLEKATNTASAGVTQSLKDISSKGLTLATASQLGASLSNSNDETLRGFYNQTMQNLQGTDLSQSQKDAVAGATLAKVVAGAGGKLEGSSASSASNTTDIANSVMSSPAVRNATSGADNTRSSTNQRRANAGAVSASAGASVEGQVRESTEAAVSNAVNQGTKALYAAELSDGVANTLSTKLLNGLSSTGTESLGRLFQSEGASSTARQIQDVQERSEIFKESQNSSSRVGASANFTATNFGAAVRATGADHVIRSASSFNPEYGKAVQDRMQDPLFKMGGPGGLFQGDNSSLQAIAALQVAQQWVGSDNPDQARFASSVLGDIANALGGNTPTGVRGTPGSGANNNREIAAGAPTQEQARALREDASNLQAPTYDPTSEASAVPAAVEAQNRVVAGRVQDLSTNPNDQSAADRTPIRDDANINRAAVNSPERSLRFDAVSSGSSGPSNTGSIGGQILAAGNDLIGDTAFGLAKDVASFAGKVTGLAPGAADEAEAKTQAAIETGVSKLTNTGMSENLARETLGAIASYSLEGAPSAVADALGFGSGNGFNARLERAASAAAEEASQIEYGKPYSELDPNQQAEIDGFKEGFKDIVGNVAKQPEAGMAMLNNVQAYFFVADTAARETPATQ